jgi:hypothetical protein
LRSQNSACEVIVVRGTDRDAALLCAGGPMALDGATGGSSAATDGPAVLLGKRYSDDDSGIELLCVKPGVGPLTFEERVLAEKSAKQLPASD